MLTIEKIKEMAKFAGIGASKKVAQAIISGKYKEGDICYVAKTPYAWDSNGFRAGTVRAYIWTGDGFDLLFSNLSYHRAKIAIANYDRYRNGEIDEDVWINYITGGYSTRIGLRRANKLVQKNERYSRRLHNIHLSHTFFLSYGSPSEQHQKRKRIRAKLEEGDDILC